MRHMDRFVVYFTTALVAMVLVVFALPGGQATAIPTSEEEDGGLLWSFGDNGGGGPCNTTADCNGQGQCVAAANNATKHCVCQPKYSGGHCEHKRHSKLTAFLLSILLGGFGADRFYLGFIGLGVCKLLLNVLACFPACIGSCFGRLCFGRRTEYIGIGDDNNGSLGASCCYLLGSCGTLCMSLGVLAWWLVDWILILKGDLDDYDGFSLYDDM